MRRAVCSRPPTIKGFQHTKDAFSSALFWPRPWHVPHGKLGPRHAHEEKVCVAHSRLEEPSMASKSRGLRCQGPNSQARASPCSLRVLLPAHEQNASVTAEPTALVEERGRRGRCALAPRSGCCRDTMLAVSSAQLVSHPEARSREGRGDSALRSIS